MLRTGLGLSSHAYPLTFCAFNSFYSIAACIVSCIRSRLNSDASTFLGYAYALGCLRLRLRAATVEMLHLTGCIKEQKEQSGLPAWMLSFSWAYSGLEPSPSLPASPGLYRPKPFTAVLIIRVAASLVLIGLSLPSFGVAPTLAGICSLFCSLF